MYTEEDAKKMVADAVRQCVTLIKSNRDKEAEVVLKQCLRVISDNLDAMQLLGLVYHRQKKFQQGAEIFQKTLELDPKNASSHNNLGLCYGGMNEFDKAINHIQTAITFDPSNADFWNNLALQTRTMGDFDAAIVFFQRALEKKDDDAYIWMNLGSTYGQAKDMSNAKRCLKKAICLDEKLAGAHVDLAYCYHLQGKWTDAWEEYEWRFNHFGQMKYWTDLYKKEKAWDGKTDVAGKTVAFWCEQGVGDTIMFFRLLSEKQFANSKKILHTQPEMIDLFAGTIPDLELTTSPVTTFDYHTSLMSLPYLLGTNGFDTKKYLWSKKKVVLEEGKKKVGIVWAGSPSHPNDFERSVRLSRFAILEKMENVQLYSLQKDIRPRFYTGFDKTVDLTDGSSDMDIIHLGDRLQSFSDTAAYLEQMDILVTVDTATLHLAGAMGVPTIALIPWNPDWRWCLDGKTTPWYPSVKLIRQETRGNWDGVFEELPELVLQNMKT